MKMIKISCKTCKYGSGYGLECLLNSADVCLCTGICKYNGIKGRSKFNYSLWEPKDNLDISLIPISNDPYKMLLEVFNKAYEQAAKGKGKERHVTVENESFEDQQICEIARRVGVGGPAYQAVKKIYEALSLSKEAAKKEILGAINYLAGMYIIIDEKRNE